MSTTMASASSVMARVLRRRRKARPAVPPRPTSLRAVLRLHPVPCMAGARPKIMPVASETTRVKAKRRRSVAACDRRGTLAGPAWARRRMTSTEESRPRTPPPRASRVLSVSSWVTMRPRPAPRAERRAISLRRPAPRASRRLATFTHAISRRHTTAAISTQSARRTPPTSSSSRTKADGRQPLFRAGTACSICAPTESSSARTWPRGARRRAITVRKRLLMVRGSAALRARGTKTSTPVSITAKAGGRTPTTV